MALAMERAGGEHGLDRCGQRSIRQRAHRSTPSWCRGRSALAVNARAGNAPSTADRRQPIRFAGYRRSHLAHGLNVRRDKGRLASSTAIFSCKRSRSISAAPSLAFSRSLSSSSPVADFVTRAASPAARNASRQPLSVAAVTPRLRETVSRSSPRNNRNTVAALRCRDILPPRPGDAAPVGVDGPTASSARIGAANNQLEPPVTQYKRIGIDTSKAVFTLHGIDQRDQPTLRINL